MSFVPYSELLAIQATPEKIRNISIVAHVDHGKTTLADCLISINGIISPKSAGKLRFLDDTPEEEEHRITMKASSISILYVYKAQERLLINLIDSPGHVDFSSEVGTAVRITDGCIVLVDVIEGICIQTQNVLRQAWKEKVRPCLVINKMDKLITELNYTPEEAFQHLNKILELVNSITGSLYVEDMEEALSDDIRQDASLDFVWDDDQSSQYFSPERGNVVFASAYYNWGFRIDQFCDIYSQKLGIKRDILKKTLWGNYFFHPKTKKIYKKKPTGKSIPMFVQFVLVNIWAVYSAVTPQRDQAKLEKIVKTLGLNLSPKELTSTDDDAVLTAIFSRWLPISSAVLDMVVEKLPDPRQAQKERTQALWRTKSFNFSNPEIKEIHDNLTKGLITCDPKSDVVAFITKVFAARQRDIFRVRNPGPRTTKSTNGTDSTKPKPEPIDPESMMFIAMARIFSGTIRKGQTLHLLSKNYNPSQPNKHSIEVVVSELYLLMGRGLQPIDEVPAGNVFGIGGVSDHILKTATLSSSPACIPFDALSSKVSPIIRVALEAVNTCDIGKLRKGMELLNLADPSVEVRFQKSGEMILRACGEVHLRHCIRELKDRFAKVEFSVSPPLILFRETITQLLAPDAESFVATEVTYNKIVTLNVRAVPLPQNITQFLETHKDQISHILKNKKYHSNLNEATSTFIQELSQEFSLAGNNWKQEFDYIWAFGPNRSGPNILLNHVTEYADSLDWSSVLSFSRCSPSSDPINSILQDIDSSIVTGFQIACQAGPLCEEPMMGVCFIVEGIDIDLESESLEEDHSKGPLSGQVMSAMKDACREAFQRHEQRLFELLLTANIQVYEAENLGKVYNVLNKRRAKILHEDVKSFSSSLFEIKAFLPAVESLGFAEELFDKTSGAASSHLVFGCWDVFDEDPNFEPRTKEELEEFGDNIGAIPPNIARQYVDSVRKRKGLPVKEKLVESGTKQRTISKKK
eukprot:TRINITY_DN485_c0_g2_i1.p1 TRINITY_DN485_c0_g2~~TRINITY_DN485_c0_g2_i1.p1  ORF type:complete len:977 (-),score=196.50 TRINITY_DN485_c0_g2_i1:39-2969(-)